MASKARKPRNVLLTDTQVKNTKPHPKRQVKLADSGGLYLLIKPTGAKGWRWKFYTDGKERLMSFGPYPEVSLKEARVQRDAARKQLKAGIDPIAARWIERSTPAKRSFKAVATEYLELRKAQTKTKTQDKQKFFLNWLKPLHRKDITTIETPDVVRAVKGIEKTIQKREKMPSTAGVETAHRCASLARRVFEHANNAGIITDGRNPAATVRKVLLPVETTHHPAYRS